MKEYVEYKAYEVLNAWDTYLADREDFFQCVESLKENDFFMDCIEEKARKMRDSYNHYHELKYNVTQFASMLGYSSIVEGILK